VSAVNYGANPATSGGFRALDVALAELRSGRLRDEHREIISDFAKSLDSPSRATEVTPADVGPHQFEESPAGGWCKVCGQLEADHTGVVNPSADGTTEVQTNSESVEILRMLAEHHLKMQTA
jgi:hypothetical protein